MSAVVTSDVDVGPSKIGDGQCGVLRGCVTGRPEGEGRDIGVEESATSGGAG